MAPVIEVMDLIKRYGEIVAVAGISLTVQEGEVFGVLGPNGAGKTTTMEIIEGLRQPTSGKILIHGAEPGKEGRKVKELVGIQLQSTSFIDYLTVQEILELFGSFYSHSLPAGDLLRRVNLEEKSTTFVKNLSGGQQQRLALALALVNDPKVLFLDEPTTGLDPQSRRSLWDLIREVRAEGRTVVLTTHYMEEAQELCDRVAIMDHGRIIALDTPTGLIGASGVDYVVRFRAATVEGLEQEVRSLGPVEREGDLFRISGQDLPVILQRLALLAQEGLSIQDIDVRAPTLEDVFIQLTGHGLRD